MYEDYYSHQVGGLMPVFVNSRQQRGHALGSVLEGIFRRFVIPLFKTHGKALARNAPRTGVNVVEDVLDGRTLKESVKRRVPESIKRSAQSLVAQSGSGVRSKRRKRRQKLRSHSKDIFA